MGHGLDPVALIKTRPHQTPQPGQQHFRETQHGIVGGTSGRCVTGGLRRLSRKNARQGRRFLKQVGGGAAPGKGSGATTGVKGAVLTTSAGSSAQEPCSRRAP
jgi:hypothetical protein